MLELLTGRPPWTEHGKNPKKILRIIKDTLIPPNIPEGISKQAKDFLEICLRVDPDLRPTSRMLFEHPFVKGP